MFNFIKNIKLLGFIFLLSSSSFVFGKKGIRTNKSRIILYEAILEDMDEFEEIEIIQQQNDDFFGNIFEDARNEAGNLFIDGDLEFIDTGVTTVVRVEDDLFDFDANPWDDDLSEFDTSDDEEWSD